MSRVVHDDGSIRPDGLVAKGSRRAEDPAIQVPDVVRAQRFPYYDDDWV